MIWKAKSEKETFHLVDIDGKMDGYHLFSIHSKTSLFSDANTVANMNWMLYKDNSIERLLRHTASFINSFDIIASILDIKVTRPQRYLDF